MDLIHTCYRVTDPERSIAFYEALGFEKRRELPIREEAVNYFLGVPGKDGPELELTYNFETPKGGYELGSGYGHVAVTVEPHNALEASRAAGNACDLAWGQVRGTSQQRSPVALARKSRRVSVTRAPVPPRLRSC
jgi:catechol 2,3-dioxygenase-like lactoylglutathione lyase family enzyme